MVWVLMQVILLYNYVGICQSEMSLRSRPNYGVLFVPLYEINNMGGSWKSFWQIGSPPDLPSVSPIVSACDSPKICEAIKNGQFTLDKLVVDIRQEYQQITDWFSDPRMLSVTKGNNVRHKRSALPFIGQIAKSLFGVATEDDIGNFNEGLEALKQLSTKTSDEVSRLGESMSSFMSISSNKFKLFEENLQEVHTSLRSTRDSIYKIIQGLDNQSIAIHQVQETCLSATTGSFQYLSSYIQLLNSEIFNLINGMSELSAVSLGVTGILSPNLVSPAELSRGLELAERGLRESYPNGRLRYGTDTLGFYYATKLITMNILHGSLLISMDVPVDFDSDYLYMYKIVTYPLRIAWDVSGDHPDFKGLSKVKLNYDVFGISTSGEKYCELKQHEIDGCKGDGIKMCPVQYPLKKRMDESCLLHIWLDHPFSALLKSCVWDWSKTVDAESMIIPIGVGSWYIMYPDKRQDRWELACQGKTPIEMTPIHHGILNIDCSCSVSSALFMIPPRIRLCDKFSQPISITHVINPFNYVFQNLTLINITGTQVSPHFLKPNITLPLLDDGTWDNFISDSEDMSHDLKEVWMKNLNGTTKYHVESGDLKEQVGKLKYLPGITTTANILIYASLVLSGFNFMVLILCCLSQFRTVHSWNVLDETYTIEHISEGILVVLIINTLLVLSLCFPALMNGINLIMRKLKQIKAIETEDCKRSSGPSKLYIKGKLTTIFDGRVIQTSKELIIHVANFGCDVLLLPTPAVSSSILFKIEVGFIEAQVYPPVFVMYPQQDPIACSTFSMLLADIISRARIDPKFTLAGLEQCTVYMSSD